MLVRAPELDSPRLIWVAWIALMLAGCAVPRLPASNVVFDSDVRNCSAELFAAAGALDVAVVIDTSQSTGRPTGFDIDRDGEVRSFQRNSALDRGDSRLAAQIAALRSLFRRAEGHDIRFSIVTFSGPSVERTVGRSQLTLSSRDSRVLVELTHDTARLDAALETLLERGSDGKTIFFAGMQRATRSLLARSGNRRDRGRRKLVLLMSDSPRPNGLDADGRFERVDPRMKNAAVSARGHGIVFHTFGISPKSGLWRRQALGQIAGATGGTYHPVEDPRHFYCHLASAMIPWQPRSNVPRALVARDEDPFAPPAERLLAEEDSAPR